MYDTTNTHNNNYYTSDSREPNGNTPMAATGTTNECKKANNNYIDITGNMAPVIDDTAASVLGGTASVAGTVVSSEIECVPSVNDNAVVGVVGKTAEFNTTCVKTDNIADSKPVANQQRIKVSDLYVATRQLASLLRAGMPMVPALAALTEQLQDQPLGEIIQIIHKRVNAGASLSQAISEFPTVFSDLFVNMVTAGQATGTLEDVLFKLADNLEKRARLTTKVKTALVYPAMMSIVCIAVIVFLMAFVIPQISKIFLDMKHTLPLPTTILIAISGFVRSYALLLAISICILLVVAKFLLNNNHYRLIWDRYKLRLPLFGKLFTDIEVSRITRTLGIILSSGVPVLQGLAIIKTIVQNRCIADKIETAQQEIAAGHSIAQAIRKTGVFPPIMYHTIAIGEVSGNLEQQLINVADACDNKIENTVKSITVMIEPIILLIMGLVVGFIVLALLLPIFEINQMF